MAEDASSFPHSSFPFAFNAFNTKYDFSFSDSLLIAIRLKALKHYSASFVWKLKRPVHWTVQPFTNTNLFAGDPV
jgi:hypothetical protein